MKLCCHCSLKQWLTLFEWRKYPFLNRYSLVLFQNLKWPKEILLLFETEQEAKKILQILFPNPRLVQANKVKIRVEVIPFVDIDWEFQSTWRDFKNFPSKPLEVIPKSCAYIVLGRANKWCISLYSKIIF